MCGSTKAVVCKRSLAANPKDSSSSVISVTRNHRLNTNLFSVSFNRTFLSFFPSVNAVW